MSGDFFNNTWLYLYHLRNKCKLLNTLIMVLCHSDNRIFNTK
ncbi:hypothetical protein EHF_0172 [Ehrlichia japonica]|uniref:Uncharacterized protein n=1 Tax=Ehrlichia japonica TaxID=391036 RepID=X5H158_9RICK|nr:hypothetical protein EHF_0172 [Ehrlichia japonica]